MAGEPGGKVVLLYAVEPMFGGWKSFTAHLAWMLQQCSARVHVARLRSRDEPSMRSFCGRLSYQNVGPRTVRRMREAGWSVVVTAADEAGAQALLESVDHVVTALVVHDTAEMKRPNLAELARRVPRCVVIRERNVRNLVEIVGRAPEFLEHPYVPPVGLPVVPWAERPELAVALSRLDWDKHTELILAANGIIEQHRPGHRLIQVHGKENRLYTHHKLQAFPDWRKVYHGPFPMERGAAEHLAARAQFVVDMSLIAGDGGGTQYTALEAWAAGAALVMATGWGEGELRPGVNMLAVDGPVELADLLLGVEGPEQVAEVIAGGTEALQRHLTPAIGAGWARLCGVWP